MGKGGSRKKNLSRYLTMNPRPIGGPTCAGKGGVVTSQRSSTGWMRVEVRRNECNFNGMVFAGGCISGMRGKSQHRRGWVWGGEGWGGGDGGVKREDKNECMKERGKRGEKRTHTQDCISFFIALPIPNPFPGRMCPFDHAYGRRATEGRHHRRGAWTGIHAHLAGIGVCKPHVFDTFSLAHHHAARLPSTCHSSPGDTSTPLGRMPWGVAEPGSAERRWRIGGLSMSGGGPPDAEPRLCAPP